MEEAFDKLEFPSPDIALSVEDYTRIISLFLDIPVHKLNNKKSLIEALHVVFTLYNEFRLNPYFKKHDPQHTTTGDLGGGGGESQVLKLA